MQGAARQALHVEGRSNGGDVNSGEVLCGRAGEIRGGNAVKDTCGSMQW